MLHTERFITMTLRTISANHHDATAKTIEVAGAGKKRVYTVIAGVTIKLSLKKSVQCAQVILTDAETGIVLWTETCDNECAAQITAGMHEYQVLQYEQAQIMEAAQTEQSTIDASIAAEALAADDVKRAAEKAERGTRMAKTRAENKYGYDSPEHRAACAKWSEAHNAYFDARKNSEALWAQSGIYS